MEPRRKEIENCSKFHENPRKSSRECFSQVPEVPSSHLGEKVRDKREEKNQNVNPRIIRLKTLLNWTLHTFRDKKALRPRRTRGQAEAKLSSAKNYLGWAFGVSASCINGSLQSVRKAWVQLFAQSRRHLSGYALDIYHKTTLDEHQQQPCCPSAK